MAAPIRPSRSATRWGPGGRRRVSSSPSRSRAAPSPRVARRKVTGCSHAARRCFSSGWDRVNRAMGGLSSCRRSWQDVVVTGSIVIYDQSPMELRQLRYVEAVARHRHFTRAADELHVAQSALSHQIKRLEAELGTELFSRNSRSVIVTEAGEAVAARARAVIAEIDGGRSEIDELNGLIRGRISVGALLPAGEIDVPKLLARFSEAHPGIEVDMREGTAGDMMRYLAEDEVHAAFSMLAVPPPEELVAER